MIRYGLYLLLMATLPAWSQTSKELERINFFPRSDAYSIAGHQYGLLNLDTPEASVAKKEVHNYYNAFFLVYAHRLDNAFLGLEARYELASENGVKYGIPIRRRFSAHGFREPELFLKWRIREQEGGRGLLDLEASYSFEMGGREIAAEGANRLMGRNMVRLALSHGLWEEEWEFRTRIHWGGLGKGEEHNGFEDKTYTLKDRNDFGFSFTTQYRLDHQHFLSALIGVVYRGTEDITDHEADVREIQAGTGTEFELGAKRIISEWTLIKFKYSLLRSEYFVKAPDVNLDGDVMEQVLSLQLIQAY